MNTAKLTAKSVLIAAHPDDEILWFSSILDKVSKVILCFVDVGSKPQFGIGRKKSISQHPIPCVSSLDVEQASVFNHADWDNPRFSEYGLQLTKNAKSEQRYIDNYLKIKQRLSSIIGEFQNVITHNPWGEYGHEEHVQVFRIVEQLQQKHRFNLWVSNYCSDRSYKLMHMQIPNDNFRYVTAETNKELARQIKQLYSDNKVWTWYDDYEWFQEESFLKYEFAGHETRRKEFQDDEIGWSRNVPLNYIKMKLPRSSPAIPKKPPPLFRRILQKAHRIVNT